MLQQVKTSCQHDAGDTGYLAGLNPQQRRAVEHGCIDLNEAPPLLIIAGAGSGKTNTLAHRVAHLVVSGADPRRIMRLTFSRRAAVEMQRRVERIMTKALGRTPARWLMRWPGRERFTRWARGCCANTRPTLD